MTELGRRERLAMGLTTGAILIYEIAILRLLSVVFWYHFAFLSISVAMLGLGASGVFFSLRPPRDSSLPRSLLAAGISMPLSVAVLLRAKPWVLALGDSDVLWVGIVILAMLLPMISLGSAVCLLLLAARGRSVGGMYAADLLGATLGAVIVIPAMWMLATPTILALAGWLPLLALAVVAKPWRRAAALLTLAIAAVVLWGAPFRVHYSKLYWEEGARKPIYEVWTPTARITVFDRPIFAPHPLFPWGWGYGSKFRPVETRELWIDQDGSAGTPIENLVGDPSELGHLLFDVTSFAYQWQEPRKVCIIGSGGGRDVLTALATGAEDVTAVELNRAIVDLLKGPLAEFSGDVYRLPGVRPIVEEGRSFLTRTRERYDLIQISLVDSWAATAAGAYSLSENYLYTLEAFRLYLSRLDEGGVLSVSRYSEHSQPFEGARLILLAREALRRQGIEDPDRHLLFVSGSAVGTLVVSPSPLSDEALARAEAIAEERGFRRHWPPEEGAEASLVTRAMFEGQDALEAYGIDLSPPDDDRPFFFQAASLFRLGGENDSPWKLDANLRSISILRTTLFILGPVTLVLFFLPFVLFEAPRRTPNLWVGSSYFVAIGIGFMLVEIPWIQQSVLFLGHPSYAAATVIGALLLGAGLGSAWTGRMSVDASGRLLPALPLAVGLISLALGPIFTSRALAGPLLARGALAAGLFFLAGLPMGMALPVGFLRFGDRDKAWFWAVNGAAGVFASAFSLALAMSLGLRMTSLIGVVCYGLAAVLARRR